MRRLKFKALQGSKANGSSIVTEPFVVNFSMPQRVKGIKRAAISLFCCLFIITVFSGRLNAQRATTAGIPWKLSSTVNQVDFYSALVDCGGEKVVLLRFVNRNNKAVKISWKEVYEVQATSGHGNNLFKQKELTLKPGENALKGCQERYNDLATRSREVAPHFEGNITQVAFQDIKVGN